MSEPAVKRPMVDLDEFERRLHRPQSAAAHQKDDPLAELARLVGSHEDPFKAVFEQQPGQRRAAVPLPYPEAGPREPHFEQDFGARDFGAEDHRQNDFASGEPQLHGTIHPAAYAEPEPPVLRRAAPVAAPQGHAMSPQELQQAEEEAWYGVEAPAPAAYNQAARSSDMPRSRRPLFITAAIVAVGVMGIGASFAYKSSHSDPTQLATIKAASGPVKVQPDQPGGVDVPHQDVSILDKSQQPVPTGVASHEEQPVDLAHQAVATIPPSANLSPNSTASSGAASVPVPPPPPANGQTRSTYQSYGIGALIEPKKVKTVSVRSDGTLLPNDKPPQMQDSAAAAPPPRVVAQNTDTSKQTTPKSTARVISMTKPAAPQSIEQLADGGSPTPPEDVPAAAKPKPVAPAKPVKVASLDNAQNLHDTSAQAATGGSGAFAVQFAAPGSETEAHELTSKLTSKYGAQLSGHRLTYHRVKVNDKDVYRVRTGGLSQTEAAALCEKVKSGGGSCFVAKD